MRTEQENGKMEFLLARYQKIMSKLMHEEVRRVLWWGGGGEGKLITGTGHPHHSQGREDGGLITEDRTPTPQSVEGVS